MATPITLSELLDIVDGGSPEDRLLLAQKLAPNFMPEAQRSGALEDVRQNFWPRVTADDADVTTNLAGTEVWGGPSRFAVLDFPGAHPYVDDNDGNTVHIPILGGGADCMFDYLVSGCYVTQTLFSFTEGMEFTTASGCTYKGYSTVQGAITDIDTQASGSEWVIFICPGTYTENVSIPDGTGGPDGIVIYGSGGGDDDHGTTILTSASGVTLSTVQNSPRLEVHDMKISGGTTYALSLGYLNGPRFYDCTLGAQLWSNLAGFAYYDCYFLGDIVADTSVAVGSGQFNDCIGLNMNYDMDSNSVDPVSWNRCTMHVTSASKGRFLLKNPESVTIDCDWVVDVTGLTSNPIVISGTQPADVRISGNLPEIATGATAVVDVTHTDLVNLDVGKAVFHYAQYVTGMNFIKGAATGELILNAVGVTFMPRNNLPTFLEDDGGISISAKLISSSIGPGTPACFDVAALSGSANSVYYGCGTISGAGASGVTNGMGWPIAQTPTAKTIATGAITVTADQYTYTIETEAAAASDDLDTISGLVADRLYLFKPVNTARTVVFKHGTGNISCIGNADITCDDIQDFVLVWYDGTTVMAFGGRAAADGLYSIARHVWLPDAAVDAVITAGDAQGDYKHSGPSGETATRLAVDAKTAPGAAGLPITLQYGDTDDLDTVASWTTIATLTLSSEKSSSTSSMTNAAVPASRLMRMNVGTIVGSPANANVELFSKVPVTT